MFKKRRREGGLGEAFSAGEERPGEPQAPPPREQQEQPQEQPQQQQQQQHKQQQQCSEPRPRQQQEAHDEAGDDEPVERAKKRAGAGAAIQFSTAAAGDAGASSGRNEGFASMRSTAPQEYGGGAFATVEIHTSTASDARAVAERVAATPSASAAAAAAGGEDSKAAASVYRGLSAAKASVLPKSLDEVRGAQTGPLRAPSNLRVTSVLDYKPDVCKDYKETGYCGYGDTCIYMHDRGDYKSGYELEKEWQAKSKLKAAALARGEVWKDHDGAAADGGKEHAQAAAKPFACHICRKPFTRPVETLCGHVFCQRCAFGAYAKSSKCAVCGAQTKGVFNSAEDKVGTDPAATAAAAAAAAP
jgi:hypothetical protein